MKQVSQKQSRKNAILYKIKSLLPKRCHLCGRSGNDLAHTLPKSIFPEYYCEEWNLKIFCRECHNEYDGNREFRSKQNNLFVTALANVKKEDSGRVLRYFGKI